ncbi:MAG TPA: hypothetical protein VGF28_03205 [Thermoanaerobaculia bacterium]
MDNVLSDSPPVLLRLPVFQDLALASTLYHEIGHHIASTVGGTHDREKAADEWSRTLARNHFRHRYWYLNPVVAPALRVVRLLIRLRDSIRRADHRGHKE